MLEEKHLLWKMQKWRMVFSFKINECVSRLTSLYAVPFTCTLYFTYVIFTIHSFQIDEH